MLKLSARTLSVWAILTAALFAQSHLGGLRGRVSDSTGASVAQAKVTLVNQDSNSTITTLSNDQGEFAFASLNPGTYRLTAEMTGFKKFDRPNLLIETQGFHSVDIKLEVGDFTQSVQVTEEAPLMETVIPTTGGALQSRQLESLPNIGRNAFMALAKASPNIVPVGDTRYQRFQDQSGTSQITIAGGPSYGNAFLVDGVPVTAIDNRTTLIPSIEAVHEVKLQANTYDAEMGRTAGGVFNTYLKSGNNQLHGSLFGYYRDPEWAANDFFRNRANIARPNQSWKNFGASIGAPVVIPKLYNGQNRTFFWIAQEAYRQKEGFAQDFSVPTLAERAGDFSLSLNRTATLQQIYDPLTTRQNDQGLFVRTPFAENKVPANRINGIGAKVAAYFPQPTRAAAFHGASNYSASSLVDNRGDQYDFKVDHEFAPWWRANASYIHYKSEEPGSTWFPNIATTAGTRLNRKTDATQVNNTFTVNPTTVVDVRYGFNRWPNLYRTVSAGFSPADLGFTGSWLSDVQYLKFPRFDMSLFSSLGAEADAQWAVYHSKNLLGNVSKLVGRHAFRMGVAYRRINIANQAFGHSAGQFSFSDTFTRADYRATDNRTGSSIAELLLGNPGGGTAQISSKFYQYTNYYGGYFQDNFRVRPNLTLNLGLRYEWETGLADRDNALIVGFDQQAQHPIGQGARGTLLYAGVDGNPTHVLNPNKNRFAPRIGVAYQLNSNTTLRGGYGIFWGPPSYSGFNSLGYTQISQFIGTIDGGRTPTGNLVNPFPTGLLKPVGNADGRNAGVGQSISFPDQNARSAYAHQFSFDVQRVLPGNLLVTAGPSPSAT